MGDQLLIGPNDSGCLVSTTVASIHRYRSPCRVIKAGQAGSIALMNIDRSLIRKVNHAMHMYNSVTMLCTCI